MARQHTDARRASASGSLEKPSSVGLTQQELEARLLAAANSLRGPVDPADFKSYVFPLLFFKWVSDTWDLDHVAAVADFGSDVTPEVEADYHRFAIPTGCHSGPRQSHSLAIHDRLQRPAWLAGMVAQGGGDAGFPGQAEGCDGEVAQAGHDAGGVAGADLGAVLAVGDVADPVQPVLD